MTLDKQFEWLSTSYQSYYEPILIDNFDTLILKLSDIKQLDNKLLLRYIELSQKMIELINLYCWDKIAPAIYNGLESIKWQVKCFCLNLISIFANTHNFIISQNMLKIMEKLISVSNDPKKILNFKHLKHLMM